MRQLKSIVKFSKKLEVIQSVRRGSNLLAQEIFSNLAAIEAEAKAGNAPFISNDELIKVYGYNEKSVKSGPKSLTYRPVVIHRGLVFSVNRAKEGNAEGWTFSFRKATTEDVNKAMAGEKNMLKNRELKATGKKAVR